MQREALHVNSDEQKNSLTEVRVADKPPISYLISTSLKHLHIEYTANLPVNQWKGRTDICMKTADLSRCFSASGFLL